MLEKLLLTLLSNSVYGPCRICKEHVWTRGTLCDFDALWNPFRREATLTFVNELNRKFKFLQKHESAKAFITTFKCGACQQYFRNQFVSPKGNPDQWYEDGHEFSVEKHGMHVSVKPFFKLLCVYIAEGAYSTGEEDDNSSVASLT
jgi:hypothetical protein